MATFAHIAPILLKRCVKCHKKNGLMGRPPEGLRLDSYAHVIAGGDRLAVIEIKGVVKGDGTVRANRLRKR